MNARQCNDWQPLEGVAAKAHLGEGDCECVQVDVDEWDARGCPVHGLHSALSRRQRESEAEDLIAYYSGPDPFEDEPAHRCAVERQSDGEAAVELQADVQKRRAKGNKRVKEVVKFAIDAPVIVALRYETGKPVEGRYGDQVMYSLMDDRVMYVPPYVEQRIRELAIAAGEPLQLCKQAKSDGHRKWIEWSVRRAPQQPLPSANETAAAAQAPGKAQNHGNGSTNGKANGHTTGSAYADLAEKALAVVPDVITGAGITAMELALNGAAEIAHRVEGRAATKNYSLRFSSEDIRAIGLTIFIQAMRDGGTRWQP